MLRARSPRAARVWGDAGDQLEVWPQYAVRERTDRALSAAIACGSALAERAWPGRMSLASARPEVEYIITASIAAYVTALRREGA